MVPYSALTDYDRSVVLTLDDRPDPQLWGHCRSTHNSSMICFFVFYIFIFIYFIYFFIVLIVDLLIIPLRFFFFVFAVVSLWHPGVGRDVRKKPLPYNYFFTSLF